MDLASEKIDRIESHLRLIKDEQKETNLKTDQILSCLIGNTVNGNIGLVHKVKEIDHRLKDIEFLSRDNQVIINQLKWVVAVIIVVIVGFLINKILI